MFGIPVCLYFINSLLTITIFQTLLLLLQRKWKGEKHVTIIFTVFLFVVCASWRTGDQADSCSVLRHLLVQAIPLTLLFQGFFWQEIPPSQRLEELVTRQILLLTYGTFSSRPSSPSRPMPYHPGLLPSRLQRASWFRCSASSPPNFLHSERPLDGAACFFHWQIFVTDLRSAQVMSPVNRWPLQRTHAREKWIAPSGNWTRTAQLRIRHSTSRPQVAPFFLTAL